MTGSPASRSGLGSSRMTPHTCASTWRDPWPSGQPYWQDPPWVLEGRVITGWFDAPWALIEASVSPDLRSNPSPTARTRLRFYDLRFQATAPSPRQLAPATGSFRESSLGFAAKAHGVEGEISAFLWSDSPVYTMWAREVFGWPVAPATIGLDGAVWADGPFRGGTGSARMADAFGTAELDEITLSTEPTGVGSPGASWLTPRRFLRRGGLDGEDRDVLLVRPQTQVAGQRFRGSAKLRFRFPPEHPLGGIADTGAEIELIDGLVLLVGADVEVLGESG